MSANDMQVGGTHYKGKEYQHWDYITDLNVPYLVANATKYASRWRDKNGVEDLRKAQHYLRKAEECSIRFDAYAVMMPGPQYMGQSAGEKMTHKFCDQFDAETVVVLIAMLRGRYLRAYMAIEEIIQGVEKTPPTPAKPD